MNTSPLPPLSLKKVLKFWEMKLSGSIVLRNFLYFLIFQEKETLKHFFIFQEMKLFCPPKNQKDLKIFGLKNLNKTDLGETGCND